MQAHGAVHMTFIDRWVSLNFAYDGIFYLGKQWLTMTKMWANYLTYPYMSVWLNTNKMRWSRNTYINGICLSHKLGLPLLTTASSRMTNADDFWWFFQLVGGGSQFETWSNAYWKRMTLHVWNIYLHLGPVWGKCRYCIPYMEHMGIHLSRVIPFISSTTWHISTPLRLLMVPTLNWAPQF